MADSAADATLTHQNCAKSEPASGVKRTRLTRNERLVLDVLSAQDGPMKAYPLLAALKEHGVKAPMTVYRALDRLEAKGLIHKLDGMNAFIICNHDEPHPLQVFLVCVKCNKAEEVEEAKVAGFNWPSARTLAGAKGFAAQTARMEIRGVCAECSMAF